MRRTDRLIAGVTIVDRRSVAARALNATAAIKFGWNYFVPDSDGDCGLYHAGIHVDLM